MRAYVLLSDLRCHRYLATRAARATMAAIIIQCFVVGLRCMALPPSHKLPAAQPASGRRGSISLLHDNTRGLPWLKTRHYSAHFHSRSSTTRLRAPTVPLSFTLLKALFSGAVTFHSCQSVVVSLESLTICVPVASGPS